jgi:hypothetical protein
VLEALFGAIVLIIANGLYIDTKRKGKRGFSRFILFWLGIPFTFLWLFTVPEGSVEEIEEKPDDAESLLAEIRRDRALYRGRDDLLPPGERADASFFGGKEPPDPEGPGGR